MLIGSGGCSEKGAACGLGQADGNEAVFRVEVVLSGFIDDTDLIVPRRCRVRDDAVELSQFERRGVVLVSEADGEDGFGTLHSVGLSLFLFFVLLKNSFDLVFLCADAMGLIPVDLRLAYRTIAEAHHGVTFELSPATFAVDLAETFALPDRCTRCDCLHVADRA